MKQILTSIIFVIIYLGGVMVAWNMPGEKYGWTILFGFVWFFLTSKGVSHLVAWFGWTEPKSPTQKKETKDL